MDEELKTSLSLPFSVKGGFVRCISVLGTQGVHGANDGICSVKDVSRSRLLFSLVNYAFFILASRGFSCLEEAHYPRKAERGLGLGSGE